MGVEAAASEAALFTSRGDSQRHVTNVSKRCNAMTSIGFIYRGVSLLNVQKTHKWKNECTNKQLHTHTFMHMRALALPFLSFLRNSVRPPSVWRTARPAG